jgi:hypothetical protein
VHNLAAPRQIDRDAALLHVTNDVDDVEAMGAQWALNSVALTAYVVISYPWLVFLEPWLGT